MRQLGLLLVVLASAAPAAAQWTVINLHPGTTVESEALGVGGGGGLQQAGFARVGPTVGHTRASLWSGSAASWVNLHPAGTTYSRAYAARDGQQVGETVTGTDRPHAALWSGTAASWIDLHFPGPFYSIAYGVAGGQQVGSADVLSQHAILWTGSAGSMVDLNPLPPESFSSEAFATDGTQQGGYVETAGVKGAAIWSGTAASWVNLHPPGNISSWICGVGGGQQAGVVRVPDSSSHAAVWSGTAASWVDLHPPGGTSSGAVAVSGGRQVGYADLSGVPRHASLWNGTAASRVDLHSFLPASFLTSEATGIWSDGSATYISGFAYNTTTTRAEAIIWKSCYPDCNFDGSATLADFGCFTTKFALGDAYADCNGDGARTLADFGCFTTKFALGCP